MRLPPTTSVCDASIVEKLIQAGAIIIGKTNLHELALGGTGVNNSFGTPSNPWGEGADTLEWTVDSPAPFHTHEELPRIR